MIRLAIRLLVVFSMVVLALLPWTPTSGDAPPATVPVMFLNLKVVLDQGNGAAPTALVDVCIDGETDPRWNDLQPGELRGAIGLSRAAHQIKVYPNAGDLSCLEHPQENPLVPGICLVGETVDLTDAVGTQALLLFPYRRGAPRPISSATISEVGSMLHGSIPEPTDRTVLSRRRW